MTTYLLPAATVRTLYSLASNTLAIPMPMSPIDNMPITGFGGSKSVKEAMLEYGRQKFQKVLWS